MNKVRVINLVIGLNVYLLSSIGWLASAATPFNAQDPNFVKAVRYGFSYTLLTSTQLNYWSDLGGDAYQITEKVHSKFGERVKVNLFGDKLDDGTTRVSVEFPELQVGRLKFILNFWHTNGDYVFLGHAVQFLAGEFDLRMPEAELVLPKDCRSTVVAEFVLTKGDIKQIQSWFRGYLGWASPKSKDQTNHIFIAPFSKSYSSSFRVYWVEGKQVIEFDRLWMKDHPGIEKANILVDFNERSITNPEKDEEINCLHSTNFELASCVRDGLLISIEPINEPIKGGQPKRQQ